MSFSDGQEIFDWAICAGKIIGIQHQIQELQGSIKDLSPCCGTCSFWMIQSKCPRETSIRPSMSGIICETFIEDTWVTELRHKRESELKKLKEELLKYGTRK